jgi:hypothetical protein
MIFLLHQRWLAHSHQLLHTLTTLACQLNIQPVVDGIPVPCQVCTNNYCALAMGWAAAGAAQVL